MIELLLFVTIDDIVFELFVIDALLVVFAEVGKMPFSTLLWLNFRTGLVIHFNTPRFFTPADCSAEF